MRLMSVKDHVFVSFYFIFYLPNSFFCFFSLFFPSVVLGLSNKAYWSLITPHPDFVIAFLPGEAFYSAALHEVRTSNMVDRM